MCRFVFGESVQIWKERRRGEKMREREREKRERGGREEKRGEVEGQEKSLSH